MKHLIFHVFTFLMLLSPFFILNSAHAVTPIPRTGQVTCYDMAGAVISCIGSGQDGEMLAGTVWPNPRFTGNADGTLTDTLTGLIWTQDTNLLKTRDPAFDQDKGANDSANDGAVTWQHALDYVKKLNEGTGYLGHNDWRLPNINELESLLNKGPRNPATWLSGQGFTSFQSSRYGWTSYYWSSTTLAASRQEGPNAWNVDMFSTGTGFSLKSDVALVWPVRTGPSGSALPKTGQTTCYDALNLPVACSGTSGQDGELQTGVAWPTPRFLDNSSATPAELTVTDSLTGLTWTKNANLMASHTSSFDKDGTAGDGAVTWQHALDYVKKLNTENYLGHSDWRLPNRNELRGMVNMGEPDSGTWLNLNGQGFSNVQTGDNSYWSSSTSSNAKNAWMVRMMSMDASDSEKGTSYGFVWPVRGGTLSSTAFQVAVTITAAPLNLSNQASGAFSFSATTTATFECKLDSGAYSACTSPYSYSALTNGPHTLTIRATDSANAGTVSDPVSFAWTVNSTLPASVAVVLPRTGQATCYDTAGAVISCIGSGQDGEMLAGAVWPYPRFVDNSIANPADLTVTDTLTGLIWTQDTNLIKTRDPAFDQDKGENGSTNDGAVTWQHALDYVKKLNTANYLGHNDWRLPNINELESLLNKGPGNPATWLSGQGFTSFQSIRNGWTSYYWSNTTLAASHPEGASAWNVDMYSTGTGFSLKSDVAFVWPVRTGPSGSVLPKTGQTVCYDALNIPVACSGTGQDGESQTGVTWPIPRFSDNGNQTVTDRLTGLTWSRDGNSVGAGTTWQQALDQIKSLNRSNYLGHNDWRLPNRDELRSMFNSGQPDSTVWLNDQFFYNIQSNYYWSASTVASAVNSAWCESPEAWWGGDLGSARKTENNGYLWPVRGGALSGTPAQVHISITAAPVNFSDQPAGTIAFNATAAASLECKLDSGAYSPCTSPYSYSGLANGQHTFTVRATSNISSPTSLVWTVNTAFAARKAIVLPRTGLTTCYDAAGVAITTCVAGSGQDGEIKAGLVWPDPRFTDNGNQTMTDNLTGLIWSKDSNPAPDTNAKTWQGALDYIKALNSQNYQGHNDWRLPNIIELESLLNKGLPLPNTSNTWLTEQGFGHVKNDQNSRYWSGTTLAASHPEGAMAWDLSISSNGVGFALKSNSSFVWPVRSGTSGSSLPKTGQTSCYDAFDVPVDCAGTGQDGELQTGVSWPIPRFNDNGNQTVTDALTGLTWTKNSNLMKTRDPSYDTVGTVQDGAVFWQLALDYVKKLNTEKYLGQSDWRLPNRNELQSLFNMEQPTSATWLNEQGFSNVEDQSYWSSSTPTNSTDNAIIMSPQAYYGGLGNAPKTSWTGYVWPVRGGLFDSFSTSSTATSFATTNTGTQSSPITISLINSSASEIKVSGIAFTGTDGSQFNVAPGGAIPCASLIPTLAAWTKCSVNAIFAPTSAGSKSATLRVTSNDVTNPTLTVSLTGSSVLPKFTIVSPGNITGGTISCTSPVDYGTSSTCSITPNIGYSLISLTDNSSNVKSLVSGSSYTIASVNAIHTVAGTFAPTISTFTIPATSTSLTVATTLSATAGVSVVGYCLSDTSNSTGCSWSPTAPATFTFATAGTKTLYAFVKDAAGNVSSKSASIIVDTTPPVVTITAPVDKAILPSLTTISGTASDTVSQVTKVEVQIASGNSQPAWITATYYNATSTWSLVLPNTNWIDGTIYTIHARAHDTADNVSSEATSTFTYQTSSFTQGFSQLSLDVSSAMILQGRTISLSGKLTRLPDNGTDLSGRTITLVITLPDSSQITSHATTSDAAGHYRFDNVSGFNQKGAYTIQTSFAKTDSLTASESTKQNLLVGSQAGYAIIVQGKIPNGEGLSSHAKTGNRIYKTLKARGFSDDGIHYLSYPQEATVAGVAIDGVPSLANMESAVTSWAQGKLKAIAAPLYIIMVDHGSSGNFIINSETLTPATLNGWLTTLESALAGTPAAAEKRIIINGSCFSGSFIPLLSKVGRVIITSAASTEESYKGPLEPDGIRSGEFFLDALFQQLGDGRSFSSAFETATGKTRQLTRKGGLSTNGGSFGDGSVQHPLLDDDGNGRGSNFLALTDGDGAISKELYLGVGDTITNSAVNPQDLTAVTSTSIIAPTSNEFNIWLSTLSAGNEIASAWAEVRIPGTTLSPTGTQIGQLTLDLPKILFIPDSSDDTGHRWAGAVDPTTLYPGIGITDIPSGMYEIYYYARNAVTLDISPMQRSVVYKQKAVNNPPSQVTLTSPANASAQKTVVSFEWTAASDPNNDSLTYTLEIATDATFKSTSILYKEEEIPVTTTYVPDGKLEDMKPSYYWRIKAIDKYGASSTSLPFSFTTDNTNGLPAMITGYVRNDATGAPIATATFRVGSGTTSKVLPNGAYLQPVTTLGTTTLTVGATGYAEKSVNLIVTPGAVLSNTVYLTPTSATENGGCGTSNGGTFTIAPTANFCITGTVTAIIGSGPWNWTCTGSNGGTTESCTAYSGTISATPTKAKVFLGAGDNFTVGNSDAILFGNTGNNEVTIASGVTGVTLDQNIERINLSAASGNYTFKQTGNMINVFDHSGTTLIVKAPVQGGADGTQISFSNGTASASAKLTGGIMTMGGKQVSSGAATALTPDTISGAPSTTNSTAKVFLGAEDSFTASSSGTTVYGNTGKGTVTIANGITGVILDQNIGQINFTNTLNSYKFKQTGNMINVYEMDGTTLIARTPVQGDSDGTILSFGSQGTAAAKLTTGGVMTLGGIVVNPLTATELSPVLR